MNDPLGSAPKGLAGALRQARALIARLTYSLSPRLWRLIMVVALLGLCAEFLVGSRLLIIVGTVSTVFVVLEPTRRWRRIRRRWDSEKPRILVARFASENSAYDDVADIHVRQIERRIAQNALLTNALEIVVETAPLRETDSERVFRHSRVVGIVSGRGLRVSDSVRWDGWVAVRWPSVVGRRTMDSDGDVDVADEEIAISAPTIEPLPSDGSASTGALTADRFSAAHARAIEALLMLVAAEWGRLDLAVVLAKGEGITNLPVPLRAKLEAARTKATVFEGAPPVEAGLKLEELGLTGLDHRHVWEACQSIFMRVAGEDPTAHRGMLRTAERGIAADPTSLISQANAGFASHTNGDEARAKKAFITALDLAAPDAPGNVVPAMLVQLFWLGDDESDWARWRLRYRRLQREDKPGVRRQLGISRMDTRRSRPPTDFGASGPFERAGSAN